MRQNWQLLNTHVDNAIRRCSDFLAANATLLGLTLAAGVFAYGYELTHLTFSIDEEVMWQSRDSLDVWLGQRRWGMYLLQRFVLPQAIYPFTSAAVAIVFLSLACIVLVHRAQVSLLAKVIFCTLFISFPTFAHIQSFSYMGAHVAFAVFLVVAAERLLAIAYPRSLMLLLAAVCLLTIAIASHQSLLFVFPTLVLFTLTADAFRNDLSFKTAAGKMGLAVVLMVGAVSLYYGVIYACNLKSNGYMESYIRWGTSKPLELLTALYNSAVPFLKARPTTAATLPTLAVPSLALLILATRSARPLLTCGLTTLLVVSPLGVHLALGTWMSSRSMMGVPFVFAGLWYLLFLVSSLPLVRGGIIVFTIYVLILHSSLISKVSLAQELTYKADTLVASRILDLIYNVRPRLAEDGTPLAFVGALNPPRSPLFVKDESFGSSFWEWNGGNPYRMQLFLQSLGLPTTVTIAPPAEWPRATALARDMPRWPDRDCVQLRGGLVIVKLSDVEPGNAVAPAPAP